MYQYISIGGWCGTRMALDQLKIVDEPHNIFDHIRSSSRGIIDCIQHDFASFLPENKEVDPRFGHFKPYIGEHFGFYHSESITDKAFLESIERKKNRFEAHCTSNKKCVFIRTCVLPQYEVELEDMKTLQEAIATKYPKLSFIIVFIIPDQAITSYYNNVTDKIFVFCVNDRTRNNNKLGVLYQDIFTFMRENDLFTTIPPSKESLTITRPNTRHCLVFDAPAVNYFEKFK